MSPDKAGPTTRAEPPPESSQPVSHDEEERRKKRKDEADAVAALLREAFGIASVEAAPACKPPPEPPPPVQPPSAPQPIQRVSFTEDARLALSLALRKAAATLHDFGIPPAMFFVYGAVVFLLVIFGVSLPAVLGSLGLMALLTALKLKPVDVLGIMSLLLLAMEAADIWRQWGRISSILGL